MPIRVVRCCAFCPSGCTLRRFYLIPSTGFKENFLSFRRLTTEDTDDTRTEAAHAQDCTDGCESFRARRFAPLSDYRDFEYIAEDTGSTGYAGTRSTETRRLKPSRSLHSEAHVARTSFGNRSISALLLYLGFPSDLRNPFLDSVRIRQFRRVGIWSNAGRTLPRAQLRWCCLPRARWRCSYPVEGLRLSQIRSRPPERGRCSECPGPGSG